MTRQELLLLAKTTRDTEEIYFLESHAAYWYSTHVRGKPMTFIECPIGTVIAAYHNATCYLLEKPSKDTNKLIRALIENIVINCIVRLYKNSVA